MEYVNTDNKFINTEKPQAIIFEDKIPEEKRYLILYTGTDDEGKDIKSYEFIVGRESAYNFLKNMIEYIDIYESIVIVDSVKIDQGVSVYAFMKHAEKFIMDPSFSIEEYNYADANEDDEPKEVIDYNNINYDDKNNFI